MWTNLTSLLFCSWTWTVNPCPSSCDRVLSSANCSHSSQLEEGCCVTSSSRGRSCWLIRRKEAPFLKLLLTGRSWTELHLQKSGETPFSLLSWFKKNYAVVQCKTSVWCWWVYGMYLLQISRTQWKTGLIGIGQIESHDVITLQISKDERKPCNVTLQPVKSTISYI